MSTVEVEEKTPVRHVKGSVDLSVGNIRCHGDLIVDDNILDGREVRAEGNIHVVGVIQAALVHSGGELRADGGITGRDKSDCRAGGNFHARYIVNAKVHADGDVEAGTEIRSSQVVCGGDVTIEKGAIIGGRISAVGNIRCGKLGSNNSKTVIEAGVDSAAEEFAVTAIADIESRRQRSAKIRQIVAPLLSNQKSLTPQQKEKATELLFEADELDAESARVLGELRARSTPPETQTGPQIQVLETAFPGVAIRLGDFEASLETSLAGPISITIRGTGADRRIVVVDGAGGIIDLITCPVITDGLKILRQLRNG